MPSRRNKRARGPISAPSRTPPTYPTSARRTEPLDHTAEPSVLHHSTPPLMRTVLGDRLAGTRQSPVVRSRASGRSRPVTPMQQVRLISPELTERAMVCARRSIRREVLFAIKGTGRGAKSKRKYSARSKVRC